jgi:hypothetical protein
LITASPISIKAENTNLVSINGKNDMNNDNLNKNTEISTNGHKNVSSPDPSIQQQIDDKSSPNPSNKSSPIPSPKDSNKFRPFSPPHINEPEIQSGEYEYE